MLISIKRNISLEFSLIPTEGIRKVHVFVLFYFPKE
jgi:hypothetical protein